MDWKQVIPVGVDAAAKGPTSSEHEPVRGAGRVPASESGSDKDYSTHKHHTHTHTHTHIYPGSREQLCRHLRVAHVEHHQEDLVAKTCICLCIFL